MSHQQQFWAEAQQRREQLAWTRKVRSVAQQTTSSNPVLSVDDRHALRPLKALEIQTLEQDCRCSCQDWSQLRLLISPPELARNDQSQQLRTLVSNTTFEGVVVLGMELMMPPLASLSITEGSTTKDSKDLWRKSPMGIHNNLLISKSVVSTQSWVHNNMILSETHVLPSAVVMACGSITASSSSFLANNGVLSLSVGAESGGGRPLSLAPESTMKDVCQQLAQRQNTANTTNILDTTTKTPAGDATVEMPNNINIISSHCVVRNTPTIQGLYMAPHSSIHAATSVINAILFPTATIMNTCVVEQVRLQWKSSIVDNSRVSDTLLMEEAHIGPNSFVASTVLGPDVHVSAGEVHCSVLGPNTNAHHQSLVISVLWPLGRGNVGYGANIGSNHTGRIPDQETTSGEGVFWGLSCVIKFPVDLSLAPYSIVAAGTNLPPQRVCMPFSLIVGSGEGNNSILPGWVLSSSPYTISRSEKKYATRRKAKRHLDYTGWKIIRPEMVHMCRWARDELKRAGNNAAAEYATDKAVKGIGSNVLSEKGRRSGIKAYTDCIQRFALEGLLDWLVRQKELGMLEETALEHEFGSIPQVDAIGMEDITALYHRVDWPIFPWDSSPSVDPSMLWRYQKSLLEEEFLSSKRSEDVVKWIAGLLETLIVLEKNYADKICQCKKRDDIRGAQTVPGYAASHKAAEEDSVVKEAQQTAEEIEATATQLIATLKQNQRSRL